MAFERLHRPSWEKGKMKIQSSLDSSSIDFVRNVEVMRGLVAELREKLNEVASGGGEASRARHTSRGKMLARQRG
jgi:3-methylcrotonyl-CoA carboxylase beta subunit